MALHHGERFPQAKVPLLARDCHIILAAYNNPCWAREQLKNLCSTDSTDYGPQWGQHLSIYVEIFQHHSLTATALWMIDQSKATSFCAFPNQIWHIHLNMICKLRPIFFLKTCIILYFPFLYFDILGLVLLSISIAPYNSIWRSRRSSCVIALTRS